jgi:hypothetical protein
MKEPNRQENQAKQRQLSFSIPKYETSLEHPSILLRRPNLLKASRLLIKKGKPEVIGLAWVVNGFFAKKPRNTRHSPIA